MTLVVATQQQADRFRNDLGANEAAFGDPEIDELFSMAKELNGDTTSHRSELYARVTGMRRLLAQASKLTTYSQDASSQNLSDIFKNLQSMLAMYTVEMNGLPVAGLPVARFGNMRISPSTRKDRPRA